MEEWLPLIQQHVPGCGITPFNVWNLSFQWWRIYRELTAKAVDEQAKKNRGARRGK